MSNGKVMIIPFIVLLIKKILLHKISYFPEPYTHKENKIKVALEWSNYATKSISKSAAGVDTSKLAKKANLASLKSDVEK